MTKQDIEWVVLSLLLAVCIIGWFSMEILEIKTMSKERKLCNSKNGILIEGKCLNKDVIIDINKDS
jgi:hypothetical protein